MALRILTYYEPVVPHISLVVREIWDSTALRLVSVQVVKGRPLVALLQLAKNQRDMGHPGFVVGQSLGAT
jgi:hypothetical protein